ncbi:MAG TPA: Gfo/Idh/MocA family oxidoreductase [Candidatus Xenobia bacterium]|jgi:predicted dehydrogenase
MRIGLVGCGRFGRYAVEHMLKVPGLHLTAVADSDTVAAAAAAHQFGLTAAVSVAELLSSPDVDLIYLATPPFLHHQHAMIALQHGKHVLCEKPLATDLAQAQEMVDTARSKQRLCVVDLLQRYNPLSWKVLQLVSAGLLGQPLHGYFENYASDENLPAGHWFWDPHKSGGIFVEHGVHFFDLFAWWLGSGDVMAASRVLRPGSALEEQVTCTARYGHVAVHFYHGFTQPVRMDRQELRLLFERGDITLHEWIPTRIEVRALVNEESLAALGQLFDDATIHDVAVYEGDDRAVQGRHHHFQATRRIHLTWGAGTEKMARYGECIEGLMAEQLRWLADATQPRRVTEDNGLDSLRMATVARRLALQTLPD